MNGLFFIHAITLCKDQDIINPIADAARYHPYTGSGANMNVPWAKARINYQEVPKLVRIFQINGSRPTSNRINLCSKTPGRMFA